MRDQQKRRPVDVLERLGPHDLLWPTVEDHPTLAHRDNPITRQRRPIDVVRHANRRPAGRARGLGEQLVNLFLMMIIEETRSARPAA